MFLLEPGDKYGNLLGCEVEDGGHFRHLVSFKGRGMGETHG